MPMTDKIQASESTACEPGGQVVPPAPGRLRVTPLGGLGEFGKNCLAVEMDGDLIVLDCGLKFPEDDMLGVDLVIPNFDFVQQSVGRLRGLVLSHGHEDHIGATPYFVRQMAQAGIGHPVPILATRLTLELTRQKLEELGVAGQAELIEIVPGERRRMGGFDLEFLPVTHSMPMAMAVALRLPMGMTLYTGDLKFDPTDHDGHAKALRDFAGRLPPEGLALLMADSTNADREGISPREESVRVGLGQAFAAAPNAIIMAVFASSLHRVQTALELAREMGRKVAVCGYSLERNFDIATRLGLIHGHESLTLPLAELTRLPPNRRLILTTGTQGEPLSALSRLSLGSFKGYKIAPGDTVILSSRIIPGNERGIYRMINHFYRRGARVVTERDAPVHASGHAYRGEMGVLLDLLRPRHLMPIHGELRNLIGHRDLALAHGLDASRVHVLENGMSLEMDADGSVVVLPTDWAGQMLVDGKLMDGVDEVVLRDRRHLSCDGMLTVILVIDQHSHKIIAGPDIVSRGFVLMDQNEALIERCKQLVVQTFEQSDKESQEEWAVVKAAVRKALRKFLAVQTDRYPVILPVVVEI
jgi:ribonuclease J